MASITTPGSQTYNYGATATVTAPATVVIGGITYNFDHWEDSTTSLTRTIPMTANKTITATYAPVPQHTVTIAVSPTGGGTTNPAIGTYQANEGQPSSVSATPATGFAFDHWDRDGQNVGTSTAYNYTVGTTNTVITAIFKAIMDTLTINSSPQGITFTVT